MSRNDENQPRGQVPVHDLDAEAVVLSALMLDPDGKAWRQTQGVLAAENFYSPANRRIFEAITTLHAEEQPVDSGTVAALLKQRERLAGIGGVAFLARIIDDAPATSIVGVHVGHIVRTARQRALVAVCQRVAAEGYSDVGDLDEWAGKAEAEVRAIAQGGTNKAPYETVGAVLRTEFRRMEAEHRDGVGAKRLLTGLGTLDYCLTMSPGDLIIVGARPGMGKSAFIGGLATYVANQDIWPEVNFAPWRDEQPGALMFSLEMPKDQVAMRLLCSEAKVDLSRIRKERLRSEDWTELTNASKRLEHLPLWIDAKSGIGLDYVRTTVRTLKRECERLDTKGQPKKRLRLVVVDYLGLMKLAGRRDATKSELVGDITRGLKQLAKEEDVVIVLCCQLNRSLESRPNKRPVLSDLRDSGEIEQDADSILFLYRDGYYNQASKNPDIAEIIIAKQRNGPPGRVLVKWTGVYTLFSDLTAAEEADLRYEAQEETPTKKQLNGGKSW